MQKSRRDFLKASGAGAMLGRWPALLALGQAACTARDAGAEFANLAPAEAADLAAIAARIIPTDATPGATEAGVIYFIDAALGDFMQGAKPGLLAGLAGLNGANAAPFSALDPARQDAALAAIETGGFFGLVRFLTVTGMFSMPNQGGNKDGVGWDLLGFEHKFVWQPPFGHYDRDYTQVSDDER